MRGGVVAFGVVLIVVGAVLAFVPILQAGSEVVTSDTAWAFDATASFSITGTIPLSISYTSNQSVNLYVESCTGGITQSPGGMPECTGGTVVSFLNGSSGAISFDEKVGGGVIVGLVSPGSATVVVKEAQTPIGDILLILGALFLLVGLVLPKRRPVPATPPPNAPGS